MNRPSPELPPIARPLVDFFARVLARREERLAREAAAALAAPTAEVEVRADGSSDA